MTDDYAGYLWKLKQKTLHPAIGARPRSAPVVVNRLNPLAAAYGTEVKVSTLVDPELIFP